MRAWIARLSRAAAPTLVAAAALLPSGALPQETGRRPPEAASTTAEELYQRGMDLYRAGDFNGAAAALLEAARRRPDHLEAHYFAGKSLLRTRPIDFPGTEREFREVLRLAPGHLDARIALAQAYFEWGRYEDAGGLLAEVLEKVPDHRGALHFSGVIAGRRGDHERAASFLRRSIQADATYVPSRVELGIALGHLGRDEGALAAFQEALRLAPDDLRALHGAGTSLRRLGRVDEARPYLVRFRDAQAAEEQGEMRSLRVQLWVEEALREVQEGRPEEAQRALARLLEEFPDDPAGLAMLGYVQVKTGDDRSARRTFARVLEVDPENLTAHYQLIGLHLRAGDRAAAVAQKQRYEEILKRARAAGDD